MVLFIMCQKATNSLGKSQLLFLFLFPGLRERLLRKFSIRKYQSTGQDVFKSYRDKEVFKNYVTKRANVLNGHL